MTITVAVLFGGQSNEHAVSCVSAGNVIAHLNPARYEVIAIGITRTGKWVRYALEDVPTSFTSGIPSVVDNGTSIRVTSEKRVLVDNDPRAVVVDVVIPMLHGKNGEDGTIQGLLEILGIPYVGSKVLASAVAMDKSIAKRLFREAGLPIGPFICKDLRIAGEDGQLSDEQWNQLGPILYVKPANSGSSVGVMRVSERSQLAYAVDQAAKHDSKIMIEKAINGREIEVAVLQWPDGSITASTPSEISMPADHPTYDFSSKYEQDIATVSVPASLSKQEAQQIKEFAVQAFCVLDCQGMARVDFFLTDDGALINEVNTIPGFTPISAYPRMLDFDGVSYSELLTILIDTELSMHTFFA